MSETKGARETIDRMVSNIINSGEGKVSADTAKRIAREAAIRADRKKKR